MMHTGGLLEPEPLSVCGRKKKKAIVQHCDKKDIMKLKFQQTDHL
jgi:hypothetical protein